MTYLLFAIAFVAFVFGYVIAVIAIKNTETATRDTGTIKNPHPTNPPTLDYYDGFSRFAKASE